MRIKIISNEQNWMEHDAIHQLEAISKYQGVKDICAMPDLHPGRTPVGAVIVTKDVIYPHLIGNDIGCGMSFFKLDIESRKIKQDKLTKAAQQMLQEQSKYGMGTIGGGNHFAEVQEIDSIFSEDLAQKYNFSKKSAFLLVHSGSRDYGNKVFAEALEINGLIEGYKIGSEQFAEYIKKHDIAIEKATTNRDIIAQKVVSLNGLKCSEQKLCESVHNHIEGIEHNSQQLFIHRKGASVARQELVVIPGSRDSLSYLVQPLNECESTYYTLAHGAGRKWNRKFCKGRLGDFYTETSFVTKKYKSKLVYREKECVFEEAPECYKNINVVIDAMVEANLIKVVATLKPLLTIKG